MVKINKYVFFGLIVLIIGGLVYGGLGASKSLYSFTSGDFVKPQWGRLMCQPEDLISKSPIEKQLSKNEVEITCGEDEYTTECEVWIRSGDVGMTADNFKFCVVDGFDSTCDPSCSFSEGCNLEKDRKKQLPSISPGQKIIFTASDTFGFGEAEALFVYKRWFPWKVFKEEGSQLSIANPTNCDLTSNTEKSSTSGIPEVSYKSHLEFTGGEDKQWIHYIYDWIPTTGYQVVTHPDEGQVYCSGNTIYELTEVKLKDGRVIKLDPGSQIPSKVEDDLILQSYGSPIKKVECCYPTEASTGCCPDFTRGCIADEVPCTLDIECANGGSPRTQSCNSQIAEKCVNNVCVAQDVVNVQCTADACCPEGKVCNLLDYTCIDSGSSPYCGDGVCSTFENNINGTGAYCEKDCGTKNVDEDQDWIPFAILGVALILGVLMMQQKQKGNIEVQK